MRSRIVHGDKLKDKDIYIENNQTSIYIPKMAVDFLRIVLVFMINNSDYLKKARKYGHFTGYKN